MKPGDHGSTFAGNPLVTRAAEAVVDIISGAHASQGTACRLVSALSLTRAHLHMRGRKSPSDLLLVMLCLTVSMSLACAAISAASSSVPLPDARTKNMWKHVICNQGAASCEGVGCCAEPAFLESVVSKGERLRSSLQKALKGNEHVKEIRGLGLITGIQLDQVQCSPARLVARLTGRCQLKALIGRPLRSAHQLSV